MSLEIVTASMCIPFLMQSTAARKEFFSLRIAAVQAKTFGRSDFSSIDMRYEIAFTAQCLTKPQSLEIISSGSLALSEKSQRSP